MSEDLITVVGVVGTVPYVKNLPNGTPVVNFRLASGRSRFDSSEQKWIETGTNWYSVAGYRQLAQNLAASLNKGDHVVVSGRLRIREWTAGEKRGIAVDIEADAIGHDLRWGTSSFTRSSGKQTPEPEGIPSESGGGMFSQRELTTVGPAATEVSSGAPPADAWYSAAVPSYGPDDAPPF